MDGWIMEELQTVDLRDKRLEKRLISLLDSLSKSSTASIPAACSDRAEMVAAYRFFDNDKVDFESVLAPHIDASCRRVARQHVALLVQDTTELDLTRPEKQMQGTGPLHRGKRCGALLHLLHAFSTDGTPLGTVYAEAWAREDRTDQPKRGTSARRVICHQTPFEDKESYRWLETAEQCETVKAECPETQLVMIADRESDIADVIAYCKSQEHFDWVIRSGSDRISAKKAKDEPSQRVVQQLKQRQVVATRQLAVRSRVAWGNSTLKQHPSQADRDAREITVTIHRGTVNLNDSRRGQRYRLDGGLKVNAVLVSEVNPPQGVQPVEWLLLTSLPIRSKKQVEKIIDYYQQRWVIELYFKTLKSGCKIESRRFEHLDRFLPSLALYMIVAWRSLYVCRVSRSHAESSCELVYSESEWRSVWQIVKGSVPPRRPPRLMEMTRIVAELGGYVNRKHSGPPGPQSTWLALQRMHDIATCWLAFGPGANKTCV